MKTGDRLPRFAEHLNSIHPLRVCAYLALPYFLSQFVYHAAGIRFDSTPLQAYPQYIDPPLLEQKLLRSLFYLHSQPPLFNMFLGLVAKLAPAEARGDVFAVVFLVAGYVLYCTTVLLPRRLGVPMWMAAVLGTVFMFSPSFVLYEHWLFYEFPLASLLAVTVLALHQALLRPRAGWVVASCALLAILCGTRSAFHLVYYLGMVTLLVAFRPWGRAQTAEIAGAFLVPVVLLYVKNLLLFGVFALGHAGVMEHNVLLTLPPESLVRGTHAAFRAASLSAATAACIAVWILLEDRKAK